MDVLSWRMVPSGRGLDQAFSGEGARLFGGRWNSVGTSLVYTSESIALATLETCVHLYRETDLSGYWVFPVKFSSNLVKQLDLFPEGWDNDPILPQSMKAGDKWVREAPTPVLKVPSVIVPWEYNYLLNPDHPEFNKITIGKVKPFSIDTRLTH